MKLSTLFALVGLAATRDKCCETCPEDKILTYSIVKFPGKACGRSCIKESDFWKYKIFEPNMKRAETNNAHPCADNGLGKYWETETHGAFGFTVDVDLYHPTEDLEVCAPDCKQICCRNGGGDACLKGCGCPLHSCPKTDEPTPSWSASISKQSGAHIVPKVKVDDVEVCAPDCKQICCRNGGGDACLKGCGCPIHSCPKTEEFT